MFLTGLNDDYEHDGRVILELVDHNVLPRSLHEHSDTLLDLGQIYKQIDAPFGELAENTLKVSTYALESDSTGDAVYASLENKIASWTVQRDALTAQIKSMLEGAEFRGREISDLQAWWIMFQAQALLDEASWCGANPGLCARPAVW
jgi:hypothetical protein